MPSLILIVVAELILGLHLKFMLEKLGYNNIIKLNNGTKAVNFINNEKIYFAILDLHISDKINGIDVAKELMKKNVPFIFLLSNGEIEIPKELTPISILKKPIDENQLKAVLDNIPKF